MTRPAFCQIASPLDVSDEALERLNDSLGVPALVTPGPKKNATGQNPAQGASKPEPGPYPTRKAEKRTTESPKSVRARREVKLGIDLPEYVRDAVNIRAATERCTARHIVMQGLLALGFEIDPADLAPDGRQQPKR